MYGVLALSAFSSGVNPVSEFFAVNPVATPHFPNFIDPNIPSSRPYTCVEESVFVMIQPATWIDGAYSMVRRFDRAFSFPVAEGFQVDPAMQSTVKEVDEAVGFRVGPITQVALESLQGGVSPTLLALNAEVFPDGGLAEVNRVIEETQQKLDTLYSLWPLSPADTTLLALIQQKAHELANHKKFKEAIIEKNKGKDQTQTDKPHLRHAQEL